MPTVRVEDIAVRFGVALDGLGGKPQVLLLKRLDGKGLHSLAGGERTIGLAEAPAVGLPEESRFKEQLDGEFRLPGRYGRIQGTGKERIIVPEIEEAHQLADGGVVPFREIGELVMPQFDSRMVAPRSPANGRNKTPTPGRSLPG